MEIIFYQNYAEKNRVNKKNFLVEKVRLQGNLREACSVRAPLIAIQMNDVYRSDAYVVDNDLNIVLSEGQKIKFETFTKFPQNVNYAYIPEFNRYYFITDVKTQNTNLYQFSFVCDVLMTYKDDINNIDAVVNRIEFSPEDPTLPQLDNTLIDDRIIKKQEYERTITSVENNVFVLPSVANSYDVTWKYTLLYRSNS